VARVSTYSSEARYVWRGQPDLSWGLNPGLVRRLQDRKRFRSRITETLLRGHEQQLLDSAVARGYGTKSGAIELLAVLQHHGAATRLLDVSSDPMVAMWFAVEDEGRIGSDGVLFAINVSRAKVVGGTETRPWDDILDDLAPDNIAYYEPPGADERIKVQRGRFVFSRLSGNEPRELSLPISIENWTADKRDRFFGEVLVMR
jgi:FRG domain